MHDPLESVTSYGTIETGVSRHRVPALFQPVLDAAVVAVRAIDDDSSLYVYGSVATGMARLVRSDVDLLTVGVPSVEAAAMARNLSVRFSDVSSAVEVAAAQHNGFSPDTDEGYGGRVFLRHYCVHLAGPDLRSTLPEYAADVRAARGFNGDIALHVRRWRVELDDGRDPVQLSRRLARKTLLAVAGLVSVHDATWTTDRESAAARWAEVEPSLANNLNMLLAWSRDGATPDREAVDAALVGVVARIVTSLETSIGLWNAKNGR